MIGRLALFPVTLLLLSLILFAVLRVLPGDVADIIAGQDQSLSAAQRQSLRESLGLDDPLPVQYLDWLKDLVRLDFGTSLLTGDSIGAEFKRRLPVTLELTILAFLISLTLGATTGAISALKQDTVLDHLSRGVSLIGLAMPLFWLQSLVRNLVLPKYFDWLPPPGYQNFWEDPGRNLQQFWLPALLLGFALSAIVSRVTRSTMLDVLQEDYIRTARAKGLLERTVVLQHALRNASLPILTLAALQFAALMGGAAITESIFGLPGIGLYVVNAIGSRDYPIVQAGVMLTATMYLVVNLAVDLAYIRLDPRLRRT